MPIKFLNTVAVDTSVLYVDTINDKVGIGTASPSFKLDVLGDGIRNIRSTAGWAGWFQNNASSSGVIITAGVDSGDAPLLVRKQDTTEIFSVRGNGTSYFQNGNVGIGTTSPSHDLTINSATGGQLQFQYNTLSRLRIEADSGGGSYYAAAGFYHRFFTSGVERMRIDSSGNVGIGTAPDSDAELHVYRNGSAARVRVEREFNPKLDLESLNGYARVGTLNNFPLTFQTNGSERIRITSSGNVGIGTTSPDTKLHVEGNLLVDAYNQGENNGIFFSIKFTNGSI